MEKHLSVVFEDVIAALEEELGFELTKEYSTPAGNDVFKVDKDSKKIDEKKGDMSLWYYGL